MTTAQPDLEAFQYTEPEYYVVRIGTGTGTTGVLNQVKSVSGTTTADYPKTAVRRIGSATATTIRGTPEYNSTCTIEFYDEADVEDWLAVAGQGSTATAGVSLDVTDTVTIQVELYTAGTAGILTKYHRLTGAWVNDHTPFNLDADTTPNMFTMNLTSDAQWVTYTVA